MTTPTGLSPEEVRARLNQGDEIVAHAQQSLQRIQDTVTEMVGNSWRGQSAGVLAQRVQQTHDETQTILNAMQHALETAKHHAGVLTSLDQEV